MSELTLLRVLLLVSMALAPLGTPRLSSAAERSRLETASHVLALACAALGLFTPAAPLCTVWLLFCAARFALFLRSRAAALRSPGVIAACVPFAFSNVAAVWLAAGANDLHLLGYGEHFSYYASLHGNVLGCVVVGALALLVERGGAGRRLHFAAVLVCLASFLAIALGIDRLHALKPVGLVGLSVALPASQLVFLRDVRARSRAAFTLGSVGLAGLVVTLALAWANQLSTPALPEVAGIRAMVSVHGLLNTVVVAPCLLLAVKLAPPSSRPEQGGPGS